MTAALVELADKKGTVRSLRHKVQSIYSPLYGQRGLSADEQLGRIDAALQLMSEAREALESARLVIAVRAVREAFRTPQTLAIAPIPVDEDSDPAFDGELVELGPEKTGHEKTGHEKLDAILTEAYAHGFMAEVTSPDGGPDLSVTLTNDEGDVIQFGYTPVRKGILPGSWTRGHDGKTFSIRKPYSIRAALDGVAKN